MANTTNYNWETPDDTDLVKDGAAAIRTLGSSIDTTTKNLNPETTTGDIAYRSATANTNTRLGIGSSGQVLTVAAGVPSWATPSTFTSPLTTKGDIYTRSASADTRLPVGTNGHTLVANSATATGLEWQAPASGGLTLLQTLSLTGSSTTSSSLSASYKNLIVYVKDTRGSVLEDFHLRFNSDTGNNYSWNLTNVTGSAAGASTLLAGNYFYFGLLNNTADIIKQTHGSIKIWDYNNIDSVFVEVRSTAKDNTVQRSYWINGVYDNSAAISTITFLAGTATFTAGSTAYIYGES